MTISWPTATVLVAALALLGSLAALDHAQAAAVVGLAGTIAGAALPQLVRRAP